jgi:hypothetical protein
MLPASTASKSGRRLKAQPETRELPHHHADPPMDSEADIVAA